MARILVSLEIREGFMKDTCLETSVGPIIQILYYEGILF